MPEIEPQAAAGCDAAAVAGWAVLASGGAALDAVIAAVTVLEDDPVFNAGLGSCLTANGEVEMDASLMDGARLRGAGVGMITSVCNPIRLAHALLLDGRHVLMSAAARRQSRIAADCRPHRRSRSSPRGNADAGSHAVELSPARSGAVAVDGLGHVAAATSTGGLLGKCSGRVAIPPSRCRHLCG